MQLKTVKILESTIKIWELITAEWYAQKGGNHLRYPQGTGGGGHLILNQGAVSKRSGSGASRDSELGRKTTYRLQPDDGDASADDDYEIHWGELDGVH